MKVYEVTIRASTTRTFNVEAWNRLSAEEKAHKEFSVLSDSNILFAQETLKIKEDESSTQLRRQL